MVAWQTVRVHGAWLRPDGTLKPGKFSVYSNAQVTHNLSQAIILPLGLVYTGNLNEDETAHSGASLEIQLPLSDDPSLFPQAFTLQVVVKPEGSTPVTFTFKPKLIDVPLGIDLRQHLPDSGVGPTAPNPIPGVGVVGGLAILDSHGYLDLSQVVTQATNLLMVDSSVSARPYVPTGYTLIVLNRVNTVKPLWAQPGDLFLFAPTNT